MSCICIDRSWSNIFNDFGACHVHTKAGWLDAEAFYSLTRSIGIGKIVQHATQGSDSLLSYSCDEHRYGLTSCGYGHAASSFVFGICCWYAYSRLYHSMFVLSIWVRLCVCCREEVTCWERSFQWDKKMTFLVGYFEYTHERFDLCDQKSCILPLIIGYWAIGIAILSRVIFIQRRLGSVEIRQRLRSELLIWSFGKTFFMVYMVSFHRTDKNVTYFWGDVFWCLWNLRALVLISTTSMTVLGVQRAGSLNDRLQMLQTEKHAVIQVFDLSVEKRWQEST